MDKILLSEREMRKVARKILRSENPMAALAAHEEHFPRLPPSVGDRMRCDSNVNSRRKRIAKIIKQNPGCKTKDIAARCGAKVTTISNDIGFLRALDECHVVKRSNGRGGVETRYYPGPEVEK